eukprot:gene11378-12076_t
MLTWGCWPPKAALAALEEDLSSQEVCARHFEIALNIMPPSAPPSGEMMQVYRDFQSSGQLE